MRIRHIVICGLSGYGVKAPSFVFDVRIREQISRRMELQSHILRVRTDWRTISRTEGLVIDNLMGPKQVADGEARVRDKPP